jgi:hypothetical protein
MNTQCSDHSFASKRCGQHLTPTHLSKMACRHNQTLYDLATSSSSYFNQQQFLFLLGCLFFSFLLEYIRAWYAAVLSLLFIISRLLLLLYVYVPYETKQKKYHRRVHLRSTRRKITEKTNDRRSKEHKLMCRGKEKRTHAKLHSEKRSLPRRSSLLFCFPVFLAAHSLPQALREVYEPPTTKQKK